MDSEFVAYLSDVLKWFVQGNDAKVGEFARKLWDFFRHKVHSNGPVPKGSIAEWLRDNRSHWPEWFQFFEYCIWQSSREFLDEYKHSEAKDGHVKGMIDLPCSDLVWAGLKSSQFWAQSGRLGKQKF